MTTAEETFTRARKALDDAKGRYADACANAATRFSGAASAVRSMPDVEVPTMHVDPQRIKREVDGALTRWQDAWDHCQEAGAMLARERRTAAEAASTP